MHDSSTNTVSRLKGSYNLFSPCRTSYNRTLFQVLFPDTSYVEVTIREYPLLTQSLIFLQSKSLLSCTFSAASRFASSFGP